jgi:SAM-dependent methyltransferase
VSDLDREYTTGERVYLGRTRSAENEDLHVERYRFALDQIREGEVVVDAACGSGYGTELIADKAAQVIGLDISDHALHYAIRHHKRTNIEYRQANFDLPIPLPSLTFDAIVCFETIEHVSNPDQLVSELHRILKPDGLLILSSPDRAVSERLHHRNKFHVHELSRLELTTLIGKRFTIDELYGQVPYTAGTWQRPLVWLARLDVANLRGRIGDAGGLLKRALGFLRPVSVSSEGRNIVRIDAADQALYVYMVVLARKDT